MCDEILVCAYGQINLRMSHGSFLLLVMIKLFLFFGVGEDSRFDKPNWSMSEEMRKERKKEKTITSHTWAINIRSKLVSAHSNAIYFINKNDNLKTSVFCFSRSLQIIAKNNLPCLSFSAIVLRILNGFRSV